MTDYVNFGDVSVNHGQVWIKDDGDDDFARVVTIHSGSDVGLADNQYMIECGSIYFDPNNWISALSGCGQESRIGPPEFLEIAYGFYCYRGFDRDTFGGFEIVQIGKTLDDWTARGTSCDDPDKILHGNASIDKYLREEFLC